MHGVSVSFVAYPESAEVLEETSLDQILASKVKVQYLQAVWIWCNIVGNELIYLMDEAVNDLWKNVLVYSI